MYCLSDQQVDFIAEDILRRGIHIPGLQENLLDHICILMEQKLERGKDFGSVYSSVIQSFYRNDLREIEEETLFLMKYSRHLLLNRPAFFALLFIVFTGPFLAYDVAWMINSFPRSGWYLPQKVWGSTLVYSLFPLLTILVLLFTPERLEPIIPRRSKILLGVRPLIKVIPAG